MANRRVLVTRRKAVRNIRKITRTMQLIATARFQAAYNRAVATKPYTQKLAELVADLSSAAETVDHPLLESRERVSRSALVVITSARGLAGGYNANILRTALAHLDAEQARGVEPRVHMVGRKGIAYFRFLRREMAEQRTDIGEPPRFEQVEPIANDLMDRFLRGEIDAAYVGYMKFISTGQQRPVVDQILPLAKSMESTDRGERTAGQPEQPEQPEQAGGGRPGRRIEYEFSPGPADLLGELLPAVVRMRLFQAFTDAAVSEQVARMVAMKAATDAAGDMIKSLTRQYNRARQTQITMELLDIVGGANALS